MSLLRINYVIKPTKKSFQVKASLGSTDLDRIIKQNRRLKKAVRRRRSSLTHKMNDKRVIIEELDTFMELMDNVVDVLSGDIEDDVFSSKDQMMFDDLDAVLDMYDFCGEIPDDFECKKYDY
jgi:hypothetical protein